MLNNFHDPTSILKFVVSMIYLKNPINLILFKTVFRYSL